MNPTAAQVRRSRRIFILLAVLFIIPPAAAYLLYYALPGWIPQSKVNNGELMMPIRTIGAIPLQTGNQIVKADRLFHQTWSLVIWGGSQCDAACSERVFMLNNIRELLRDNHKRLRVFFIARIRAERKFPGVDALVAQIRLDIEESRRLLA